MRVSALAVAVVAAAAGVTAAGKENAVWVYWDLQELTAVVQAGWVAYLS